MTYYQPSTEFSGTLYRLKKLKAVIIFMLPLLFALMSGSKATAQIGSDRISIAAPHLPKMIRYDNEGKAFHSGNYLYKAELNKNALKLWGNTFSAEVEKYKAAVTAYLKTTDVLKLSEIDANRYHDVKAQWMMACQLFNWQN
jgi:hypothetical protein